MHYCCPSFPPPFLLSVTTTSVFIYPNQRLLSNGCSFFFFRSWNVLHFSVATSTRNENTNYFSPCVFRTQTVDIKCGGCVHSKCCQAQKILYQLPRHCNTFINWTLQVLSLMSSNFSLI